MSYVISKLLGSFIKMYESCDANLKLGFHGYLIIKRNFMASQMVLKQSHMCLLYHVLKNKVPHTNESVLNMVFKKKNHYEVL